MKPAFLLALFLSLPCIVSAEISLPAKDSEVSEGGTIIKIEPDGLVLTELGWGADQVKLPFFTLTPKTLEKYGLSEASAREYQSKFAEARSKLPTSKSTLADILSSYGTPNFEDKKRERGQIKLSDSAGGSVVLIERPSASTLTYFLPSYTVNVMFDEGGALIAAVFYPIKYEEKAGFSGVTTPYKPREFSNGELVKILRDFHPSSEWKAEDPGIFSSSDGLYAAYLADSKESPRIVIANLKKLK